MSKSIGIDLGTTNSVSAIKMVHTEVLKNAEGDLITPSCVTLKKKKLQFSKDGFVVGKHALEWMKQDPENTIVAIEAYNEEQINDKTLATTLRKALALDTENEHARGNLNHTKVDLERISLIKALDKHKMNKACKIAAESEYQEVRDDFFSFFKLNLDSLDQMGFGDNEKAFLLRDFYGWCARVDESHPILYNIDDMIEQLE